MDESRMEAKVGAGETAMALDDEPHSARPRWIILLIAALVFLTPLLVFVLVGLQGPQLEREAYTSLEIAARLKVQQVESWFAERRGDGRVVQADADLIEHIASLQTRPDEATRQKLMKRLEALSNAYAYPAIYLLDPKGKQLLARGEEHELSSQTLELLPRLLHSGESGHSDAYIEQNDRLAAINFIVPLTRKVAGAERTVGVLVLHTEPTLSLFPMVLEWPSASPSGETLLGRREGDSVVFLNSLRHARDTALKLHKPFTDALLLPAATAIRAGVAGRTRGRDYRGVDVLAVHLPVDGTDWHLIVKIDYDEVMAPMWRTAGWVGMLAFALIILIGVLLRMFWSQQASLLVLASSAKRAQALRESEARLRAVTETARDAIVTVDATGTIVGWNSAATKMFGFALNEIVGQSLTSIVPQRFHQRAMDSFFRMLNGDPDHMDGTVAELFARRKDNSEILIDRSVALWHTEAGDFYTCTMRDITERKQIEVGLQQSEEKLRAMTDNISTVMFLKDLAGRYLHVNRQYETLFHVSNATFQGKTDHDIFPANVADAFVRNDQTVIQSGRSLEMEEEVPQDDGIHTYISVKFPVRNVNGEIYAICGIATDVTERKQQQEHTRRLLAENETILSNALVGIVYLKERHIVSCNRRLEEIFHYEPGELLGESTARLYDSPATYDHIDDVAYQAVSEGKNFSCEVLLRHKDGSIFWGALNGRAIDPAHPHDGSIWIYADISERRSAAEESNKLRQAVEQSQVSIVITNRDGVIEYVNPCFTRITGYTRDEAIGRSPSVLKSDETPREVYRDLWQTILGGGIWIGALQNRCKNGDLIWENTSISPIFSEAGEITHFVAVKEDVTERKRIAQQLEQHQAHLEDLVVQRTAELTAALEAAKIADRSKDEFLANITHELRTPLSAVIGFSSLARPFSSDPRQRDYLDKVNSAGKTLSGIIDDLLDLSKIAAGRMEFEASPFSLRQLISRSRLVISYKAQEKGLQLVETIGPTVPEVLVGDSLRVEQILLNLLSNAVKFTSAGRVELRVGVLAHEAERVCLSIDVEDTGIGLSAEAIALLFKPFSQADASMTRKFGGTGLGLAICKRLSELMGGEISVTSREGSGSTFHVKLWLGLGASRDLPAAEESSHESAAVRYRDVRVLVVDDQPFNRDVVEGLLAAVGITPRLAQNGQEALDIMALGTESFDLVLMDIQMPVMDGLSATRVIRKLDGFVDLPIIAMTAHTMAHEREMSAAAGMNDHIGKPFDEEYFYRTLAKWVPREKQYLLAAPEAVRPASNGLPLLAGVDTRAGLALLLGDEARYQHWLGEFVAEAPAAMIQIRQMLAAGTPDAASMVAHTLKGRMGLLGMKALHAISAALETAIDKGAPASDLLLDLERGVAGMCAEIVRGLGPGAIPAPAAESAPDSLPAFPHATALDMMREGRGGHFAPSLVDCLQEESDEFRYIASRFRDDAD